MNTDFIISFFLPDGMIDWFEVVKIVEEENTGKAQADILYNSVLNQYPLTADGTKVSVEFGLFFKDSDGQSTIDGSKNFPDVAKN